MVKRTYKTKNMAYDMPWHDRVPYTLGDGVEVPSVTEVLSIVGNADGLINWAVMLQRNGIDWKDERNHLADIGTTTHNYIEQYIKTLQIPEMSEYGEDILTLAKPPILAFHDWFTDRTITPHATELRMVSETWELGGTADLIAYVDGNFEIIDFKTGAKNEKNKIQVAAYVKLAKENGMNVSRGRLVHLDRKYSSKGEPQYSEIIIEEDEIDEYFVLFRAAKAIYKKMHKPKRKGKIMPLQDVPNMGEEITPGQYRVKLTAIEDGEPGQWGPTVFWCYDVFDRAGKIVKQLRNLQSAKTGYGSRAAADATALGYAPQGGDSGLQIEAAIIGREATANIALNKNGYLTVESLAPLSQPSGGVTAPAGDGNAPF